MTATAKKADPAHRKAQRAVQAARRELALSDDSYRAILKRVTGRESSKTCTAPQLGKVLSEFRRLGWLPKPRQPARAGGRKLATGGQAGKIRALWMNLYHLGEIGNSSEDALAAFAAKTVGIEALQWLDPAQADRVINALRGWLARIGFPGADAARIKAIEAWRHGAGLPEAPAGFADKVALIEELWRRLKVSGAMEHGSFAALGRWISREYGVATAYFLTPEQADAAAEKLGAWLRRAERGGS